MDVERTIEFLLSNQAKHEERLGRLEAVAASLAGSVEKLADNVERLDEAMVSLAESGVESNRRIDALGMRMDQLGMRVDQLVGAMGAIVRQIPPSPAS